MTYAKQIIDSGAVLGAQSVPKAAQTNPKQHIFDVFKFQFCLFSCSAPPRAGFSWQGDRMGGLCTASTIGKTCCVTGDALQKISVHLHKMNMPQVPPAYSSTRPPAVLLKHRNRYVGGLLNYGCSFVVQIEVQQRVLVTMHPYLGVKMPHQAICFTLQ